MTSASSNRPERKRIAKGSIAKPVLSRVLLAALAVVCAVVSKTLAQESSPDGARPTVKLGKTQHTKADNVAVPLEFSSNEPVLRLRIEIVLSPGAWRFRKAQTAANVPVKISVKQQRERRTVSGREELITVLRLDISPRGSAIPNGVAAQILFTRDGGDSSGPDLTIRKFDVRLSDASEDARRAPEPPPLEPPSPEPPRNPAPTCFFFTH